jgi:outer membrane lipoprotein-sorting protein
LESKATSTLMSRPNSLLLAIALFAMMFSSGCLFRSRRVPTRTTVTNVRSANLDEMVKTINTQAAAIKTLNATVDIDTSVGGVKKGKVTDYQQIRGYILVRKPEQLRMIGLFPVVRNRAFDMVSDPEGFKLSIPAKNKFYVGPPEVTKPSPNALENLRPNVIYDALLLRPVDPANEVAVLEQGSETITDSKTKNEVAFPTYVVDVIRKGPQGWFLSRKVVFSRIDLEPHKQLIYDAKGNLMTEATYDEYRDYSGLKFPSSIQIQRPKEEYTIGLNLLKLTVNEPIKDDQFALTQPPGAQVVRLDASGTQRETPGGDGEKK